MSRNKQVVLWLCALILLLGWALNPRGSVRAADVPLAAVLQQTPEDPGGETPGDPDGDPPEAPNGETPGEPDGDPPEDPNGETPGDPNGDPPEAPNGETPGEPDGDPPEDPNGETPGDPDGDPPEDPDAETPGDPDGDPPEDPNGETPGDPDGDPPEDPNGETPGDPDGDPPEDPNGESPGDLEGETPGDPSGDGDAVQVYIESLGTRTLAEGDGLYYQTVAPKFADMVSPPDYYPGALTVRVDGQVTVGAGAVLTIGTMSVGSTQELSPLIQDAGGQIVVQAGGELALTDVEIKWTGEEPLIVQEPGAVVSLYACQDTPEGAIQWDDAPVVDNAYQNPGDIWLIEGTPLTAGDLPQQLNTYLVTQGRSEWTTLSLQWDLSPYEGQTQGSITLTGQFLDENGAVLESRAPLTVTVHWYPVGTLAVTQADWIGDKVPVARLALAEIPEEADRVWGEVSEDSGVTWIAWEDCNQLEILGNSAGGLLVFSMPDTTPRLFRAAAENQSEHLYWVSEAFLLPAEDSDDQGGNRGGSTLPDTPDRTPAPAPGENGVTEPENSQPPQATPVPSPGGGWGNSWEPQPTPDQSGGDSGQGGGDHDPPQPGQPPEPEPSEPVGVETPQPAPGPSRPGYTQQILQWLVTPHAIPDNSAQSPARPPAASTQPAPSASQTPAEDGASPAPVAGGSPAEDGTSPAPAASGSPAEEGASPAPAASGSLAEDGGSPAPAASGSLADGGASPAPIVNGSLTEGDGTPAPETSGSPAEPAGASPTPAGAALGQEAPALPLQIGLAAAGAALCTLVGLGAAGKGPFRRKG